MSLEFGVRLRGKLKRRGLNGLSFSFSVKGLENTKMLDKNIEIKVEDMHVALPERIVAKIISTGKFFWIAMVDYTSKAAIEHSPIIGIFSDYDDALKAANAYLECLSDNDFKEAKVIVEPYELNKDYYQYYELEEEAL